MHEIICPHCSKAFKIDEAGYADILKQVRDGAFEQALHERLELAEREKRDAIALAEAKVTNGLQAAAAKKDAEIAALQAKLQSSDVARQLAVNVGVNEPDDGCQVCGVAGDYFSGGDCVEPTGVPRGLANCCSFDSCSRILHGRYSYI